MKMAVAIGNMVTAKAPPGWTFLRVLDTCVESTIRVLKVSGAGDKVQRAGSSPRKGIRV